MHLRFYCCVNITNGKRKLDAHGEDSKLKLNSLKHDVYKLKKKKKTNTKN